MRLIIEAGCPTGTERPFLPGPSRRIALVSSDSLSNSDWITSAREGVNSGVGKAESVRKGPGLKDAYKEVIAACRDRNSFLPRSINEPVKMPGLRSFRTFRSRRARR